LYCNQFQIEYSISVNSIELQRKSELNPIESHRINNAKEQHMNNNTTGRSHRSCSTASTTATTTTASTIAATNYSQILE